MEYFTISEKKKEDLKNKCVCVCIMHLQDIYIKMHIYDFFSLYYLIDIYLLFKVTLLVKS